MTARTFKKDLYFYTARGARAHAGVVKRLYTHTTAVCIMAFPSVESRGHNTVKRIYFIRFLKVSDPVEMPTRASGFVLATRKRKPIRARARRRTRGRHTVDFRLIW